MDEDNYPTDTELLVIQNWNLTEQGIVELLNFIKSKWWAPEWGYNLTGKKILILKLSTGGWSGNEDIMRALKQNFVFWAMYWRVHKAGGHYTFRIKLK